MVYILMALGVLTSGAIMFCNGLYTRWFDILIFIGIAIGCWIGWILLYILFLVIITIPVNKKKEVTKPSKFYAFISKHTMSIALFFTRVHVRIEGKEKIPKDQKFLIVGNHLSNFDPMSVWFSLKEFPLVFVSKPQNFDIPLVGRLVHKAGFMALDREHVKNAIVTINKAADYIKNDVSSVYIFPEGTRNRTQEPLLEFRNGAFKIATKAKCPLVIVAINNTDLVWKRFPWKSTTIVIKVVEVISAEDVSNMLTADLSERAWKDIYDNISHGKNVQ